MLLVHDYTCTAAVFSFALKDDYGLREDTYELCYNAACLLLAKNEVKQAEKKLKVAQGVYLS